MAYQMPHSQERAGGLERHPSLDQRFDPAVRIVDYDPTWPVRAAAELSRLRSALGDTAVRADHVGSTAVPGLAAKPIIDLQLSVDAITPREPYVEPLERLGYLFVPDPESPGYHLFAKPPRRPRSYHLHVCEADNWHERRHLAVRNYLRAHGDEATRYADMKRALVGRRPRDRLAYVSGKADYVNALERRAVAWL